APTPALRELTKKGWSTVQGYFRRMYMEERGISAWLEFDAIHHGRLKSLFPAAAFDPRNLYPIAKDLHDVIHEVLSGGTGRYDKRIGRPGGTHEVRAGGTGRYDKMIDRLGGPDPTPRGLARRQKVTVGPEPGDVTY